MAGLTRRVVFITVGLVVMVVLHLAVVIWALFRARPSRCVTEAEHAEGGGGGGGGGAGLSSEEVSELPCNEFKEDWRRKLAAASARCVWTLEAFRAGARCRVLPRCGHGFHAECVDSWLRTSRRCPVCRAEAVERSKDAAAPPPQ
jgi:predicted Zn-ribbon and HTH transcriptional regulator